MWGRPRGHLPREAQETWEREKNERAAKNWRPVTRKSARLAFGNGAGNRTVGLTEKTKAKQKARITLAPVWTNHD